MTSIVTTSTLTQPQDEKKTVWTDKFGGITFLVRGLDARGWVPAFLAEATGVKPKNAWVIVERGPLGQRGWEQQVEELVRGPLQMEERAVYDGPEGFDQTPSGIRLHPSTHVLLVKGLAGKPFPLENPEPLSADWWRASVEHEFPPFFRDGERVARAAFVYLVDARTGGVLDGTDRDARDTKEAKKARLPGGQGRAGETGLDTVRREGTEETGLALGSDKAHFTRVRVKAVERKERFGCGGVNETYVCVWTGGAAAAVEEMRDDEMDGLQWRNAKVWLPSRTRTRTR